MAEVHPFRALRPTPDAASRVASVPYDVCSTAEARVLADGNPDSFLHVIRAEIDMPADVDSHAAEVYARGRASLVDLQERGVLVREEQPALYLYRIVMGDHAQTGLVGAFSVDAYDAGKIVKHEHTRADKEEDRTQHVLTLEAQTGPVFLTYAPSPEIDRIVAEVQQGAPLFDFTAPDGVHHTVWRAPDPAAIVAAFGAVDPLYIADGHHRSAAASNARRRRREAGELAGDDPCHRFLAVAFPADQVKILPYNRLILDTGDATVGDLLEALGRAGTLEPTDEATPAAADAVCVYAEGAWRRLTLTPVGDDPVARLAPQMLQDRVLGPLLGIDDPRTDARVAFVGGIRGTGYLVEEVAAGRAKLAFSLPPVTTAQLIAVADAGLTMPPKSTWFEPKLRSGLLTYPL